MKQPKKFFVSVITILLMCTCHVIVNATIFKCIDSSGTVSFTNSPASKNCRPLTESKSEKTDEKTYPKSGALKSDEKKRHSTRNISVSAKNPAKVDNKSPIQTKDNTSSIVSNKFKSEAIPSTSFSAGASAQESQVTQGISCFELGVRYAKCAMTVATGLAQSCPSEFNFAKPDRCSKDSDFDKGLKAGAEEFERILRKHSK